MLEASGLTKRFGNTVALAGFDLTAGAGEIVGLVGHNGAGKTTFARVLVGLVIPDSGAALLDGINVTRFCSPARPMIGLAPQELALYPTATARENLLLFAGLYGIPRRRARRRVGELADALLLTDVLNRRVRELSGGQQRRLQTATAMVHEPPLLLLDEPTVGADPITRDALLAVVRKAADEGAAVVYTTHYLPELEVLDATLAVANGGRVIARGNRAELLSRVPGRAIIEFDRPPGRLQGSGSGSEQMQVDGHRLTITAPNPAASVAPLLTRNPEATAHLQTIELHPPTLDDLYRDLVSA